MKLAIFAILLIALASAGYREQDTCIHEIDAFNDKNSILDGLKCVKDIKDEIQNAINLSKAIAEDNFFGIVKDAYQVIATGIQALIDCKSLFCFGPSFKKCQEQNPGNECEQYGLIVYPQCHEGFTNWLCCVCATECPEGFRDDGLYCAKPAPYGRGAGYALWDEDKCNAENAQGCEKNGALWYPKCAEGFHAVGCCVCSPDCPADYTDIGVSCQKPESYGRGVGYAVSFGLECLVENAADDFSDSCETLQHFIDLQQQSIDVKFAQQMDADDVIYPDLAEQIKTLGQFTEKYLSECYTEPEQIE